MAERAGDVLIETRGGVLNAVIDRPERKNAINLEVVAGLEEVVARARRSQVKVVTLQGAGGTFSSGADLDLLRRLVGDETGLRDFLGRLGAVLSALEAAPFVVVAIVEGFALAGGLELVLASDIVLAATDARIGDRHLEYGLLPAAGGSVRLARTLPRALARYLLLSGEMIDGVTAANWGVATFAVPPEELRARAAQIVARLEKRGAASLAGIKRLLHATDRVGYERALGGELELFIEHLDSGGDATAGLAAFRAGIVPRFDGAVAPPAGDGAGLVGHE